MTEPVYHCSAFHEDTRAPCKLCEPGSSRLQAPGLLAQIVTCPDCIGLMCIALATPGKACPYCSVATTDGIYTLHKSHCPVIEERICSICTCTSWVENIRATYDEDGTFRYECATCQDEHPRSGRYGFTEGGRGERAKGRGDFSMRHGAAR